MPRFLQIHSLTSYPATLLNRDDAGFAKRMPFGGVTRTRISSQCLKRHWRMYDGEWSIRRLAPESIRSRLTFERFVVQPLLQDGVAEPIARAVTEAIMSEVLGESAKAKKAKKAKSESDTDGGNDALKTGQVTVLGRPEVEFLLAEARGVCQTIDDPERAKDAVKSRFGREAKENLKAMRLATGLDAALFGRMVTSDVLARGDAAIHVAHSMTVHAEAAESDYFSAIDDLLQRDEDELGSGHIGTTELTSGLFYGYLVVDLPLLVSNLEGCEREAWAESDRSLAGQVVEHLVHLVAMVSPGAKLGSTAPYAWAHMVGLEVGDAQPRTLANAFLRPTAERPDVVENAYASLATYIRDTDAMYGCRTERKLAAVADVAKLAEVMGQAVPIDELAAWARAQVEA
jgi:CRISPR system Cascade subunit CasC